MNELGTFGYWFEDVVDILEKQRKPQKMHPDQFGEWIEAFWDGLDPSEAVRKLAR